MNNPSKVGNADGKEKEIAVCLLRRVAGSLVVSIPKKLRDKAGFDEGHNLLLSCEGDGVITITSARMVNRGLSGQEEKAN